MLDLNFYGLLNAADSVVSTFLNSAYPIVAHAITPLISIVVVLYWAVFGLRMYAGYTAIDWMAMTNRAIMSVAVFSILVWGALARQIYAVFIDFSEGLAAAMLPGDTMPTMLDGLWRSVASTAAVLMGEQLANMGMVLQGVGLMLMNCLLFVIIIAYVTMAKFGLAVTMSLLPLFAGFSLFQITRQWSINWLAMMFNCALLYLFVMAIVRGGFMMFADPITKITNEGQSATLANMDVAKTTYIYLIEGILVLFLLQAKSWAATLSGNMCVYSASVLQRATQGGVR